MNVDGSVTPRIFSIQAGTSGLEIDLTRLMYAMVTTNPIGMGGFGDLIELTRGVTIRTVNGEYRNLMNFKTNFGLGIHAYDVNIFDEVKQNDVNALLARNTYAGQSKRGVVIRLGPSEQLQAIIQDDLTDLLYFWIMASGSEVSN